MGSGGFLLSDGEALMVISNLSYNVAKAKSTSGIPGLECAYSIGVVDFSLVLEGSNPITITNSSFLFKVRTLSGMVDVVSMPRKKLSSKRVCSSNISFNGCVYHILSLKERFVFVSEHLLFSRPHREFVYVE